MGYNQSRWVIVIHPEVGEWFTQLEGKSADQVAAALDRLADEGPNLGRPLVDTLTGTELNKLKELRPGSARDSALRILFAFNPVRQAVLLVAGDKSGQWNKWYQKAIPLAEQRFHDHLEGLWGQEE